MTLLTANVICLALVAVDFGARAWRIRLLVRWLGYPLSFRDAFVVNAIGDGACAISPARLLGEPARIAGLSLTATPVSAALVAAGYEIIAYWPVVVAFGLALAAAFVPAWLSDIGPDFVVAAAQAWPWLALITVLTIVAAVIARNLGRRLSPKLAHPARNFATHWRRMPKSLVLLTVPLTLINLVTRTAILPVLALALPDSPPLGPVIVGSFALLYSQVLLPTPAGVGGVEFGFLTGAAGDFGSAETSLLLWWRWWTSGIGIVLGLWFMAERWKYWKALRQRSDGETKPGLPR